MAARASGSGTISFGLVSIPFKLYTATSAQSVSFNQLHKKCGSRIKQQLICPVDNEVIQRTDIVKGYEYQKDKYVQFTDEELKSLEAERTDRIDIVHLHSCPQETLARGEVIEADRYQVELQKVKAYLALHQVYGVDLNATAVELAEISLWLDTMFEGLDAPADRRLLGIQLRCCSAEAACLSNRKEETDIVPVAENIRHLGLASRSSIHCDNRYNKVVGPKFT